MKVSTAVLAVPIALSLMAAVPAKSADPLTVAQTSNAAWSAVFAKGDAAGLAANYVEDAIVLTPADSRLEGREAIADYWGRVLADGQQLSLAVEAANLTGDSLYQSGLWTVEVKNAEGRPVYGGGNFVRVLDRQKDGSWKIRLETWN